jgi:hypothetical protein
MAGGLPISLNIKFGKKWKTLPDRPRAVISAILIFISALPKNFKTGLTV